MAEKVKVSREVADFIQAYENNVASYNGWENDLIAEHSRSWINGFEGLKEDAECMKGIEPLQLAVILTNGYEVEQTPEDKVRKYYEQAKTDETLGIAEDNYRIASRAYGKWLAVEETLNLLGIKIKGVND